MNQAFAKVEELLSHVKKYAHLKIEAAKLNAADKASRILSNLIAGLIVAFVFLLSILFASIAAAKALSEWTGSGFAGYLIVSAVYLLAGLLVLSLKERILRIPIMNTLISQLFKSNEDEED